ncbi:hypothetical protein, partial [Thiolapillus sp.]|uniref:hypothetical protein n=1 Tax=Thiolapillus sp. TaxID=2017437 RepID=UPI003AF5342C
MTRTAGAPIGCQRPSRFWGLGCPKIYHEAEDTLAGESTDDEDFFLGAGQQHGPPFSASAVRLWCPAHQPAHALDDATGTGSGGAP